MSIALRLLLVLSILSQLTQATTDLDCTKELASQRVDLAEQFEQHFPLFFDEDGIGFKEE